MNHKQNTRLVKNQSEMAAVRNFNEATLRELCPGDLVEFERGIIYSHWAVYIGNGRIIHLTGDESDGVNALFISEQVFTISGTNYNKAFVKEDDFWKVARNSKARKNNETDKRRAPHDRRDIVKTATKMIGQIGYNLWCKNCEHFAKFCRYGKSESDQVENSLILTGCIFIAFVGISVLLKGSR